MPGQGAFIDWVTMDVGTALNGTNPRFLRTKEGHETRRSPVSGILVQTASATRRASDDASRHCYSDDTVNSRLVSGVQTDPITSPCFVELTGSVPFSLSVYASVTFLREIALCRRALPGNEHWFTVRREGTCLLSFAS
jgi:hypothetical protein